MTKKEVIIKKYIDELKKIQKILNKDTESRHIAEDDILCELLSELGFNEIVELYDKTLKWYA